MNGMGDRTRKEKKMNRKSIKIDTDLSCLKGTFNIGKIITKGGVGIREGRRWGLARGKNTYIRAVRAPRSVTVSNNNQDESNDVRSIPAAGSIE